MNGRTGSTKRNTALIFETAIQVFDDPFAVSVQDRQIGGVHALLVAHTVEEDAGLIRIISARKATRRERSIYAQDI
jgi:uncharacterized DUF497 family protein